MLQEHMAATGSAGFDVACSSSATVGDCSHVGMRGCLPLRIPGTSMPGNETLSSKSSGSTRPGRLFQPNLAGCPPGSSCYAFVEHSGVNPPFYALFSTDVLLPFFWRCTLDVCSLLFNSHLDAFNTVVIQRFAHYVTCCLTISDVLRARGNADSKP